MQMNYYDKLEVLWRQGAIRRVDVLLKHYSSLYFSTFEKSQLSDSSHSHFYTVQDNYNR